VQRAVGREQTTLAVWRGGCSALQVRDTRMPAHCDWVHAWPHLLSAWRRIAFAWLMAASCILVYQSVLARTAAHKRVLLASSPLAQHAASMPACALYACAHSPSSACLLVLCAGVMFRFTPDDLHAANADIARLQLEVSHRLDSFP
jgi:hypothetical protein